jgi:dGTPase
VEDVIKNSMDKGGVGFSPRVSEALRELKSFNYERIYQNPKIKGEVGKIGRMFEMLFELYMEDFAEDNRESELFRGFLDGMSGEYTDFHSPAEVVRDFIAGMTDAFFMRQCQLRLLPQRMPSRF